MKKIYLLTFSLFLNSVGVAQWEDNGTSLTTMDNVGVGIINPNSSLDIFGVDGIRLTASAHADDYMVIKGSINVSDLNPGSTEAGALISNRKFGHLVFDINANDNGDSFAVRTDKDLDGVVDNIAFVIKPSGFVGIGTTSPDAALAVKGLIHTNEIKVNLNGSVAPDYVFHQSYDLRSLDEVKAFIRKNSHLPNMPSASEMETEGIELKAMNLRLLEKVEELTLYLIEQNERLKDQVNQVESLKEIISGMRSEIEALKKDQ